MADTIDVILAYLHKHNFSRAEDALRAELTSRQVSNGSLSLQLHDELDVDVPNVTTLFQSLQDRASRQYGKLSSDVFHPEKQGGPDSREIHTVRGSVGDKDGDSSQLLPEKAVFVDFGLDEADAQSLLGKSAFLHAVGVDKVDPLREYSGLLPGKRGLPLSNVSSSLVEQSRIHLGLESSREKDGADWQQDKYSAELSKSVQERVSMDARQRSKDDKGSSVVDDVLEATTREAEDMALDEDELLGSVEVRKESVEQLDSPQWFGIGSQSHQQIKIAPRDVMLRPVVRRPVSQQERRKPYVERRDKSGFPVDNGPLQNEKAAVSGGKGDSAKDGRFPFDDRAIFSQVFPEEIDRVYYGKAVGDSGKNASTERGVSFRDVGGKTVEGKAPWKDVPIKTSFPFPLREPSLPGESLLLRGQKVEVGASGQEVVGPQEKLRDGVTVPQAGRGLKERARSADGGAKPLDGGSRGLREAEELPRLPPVRLRSGDSKTIDLTKDCFSAGRLKPSAEAGLFGATSEGGFGLGSFLDIPVGQDVSSSGTRRLSGGSRPSVSQGIVEDASERLSGFATLGDGQSESLVEYPDEYWDSDTYDDDDDPGYHRQPIEDEEWFLANEIDYPDERSSPGLESNRSRTDKDYGKFEDDERSFLEEESYFSGEEYYRGKRGERRDVQTGIDGLTATELYNHVEESQLGTLRRQTMCELRNSSEFEGKLLGVDLNLRHPEPAWPGFVAQESQLEEGEDRLLQERTAQEDVGSAGVGISSEVAEFGSEVRESVLGGSSEGDLESFRDREMGGYGSIRSREIRKNGSPRNRFNDVEPSQDVIKDGMGREDEVEHEMILRYYNEAWSHKRSGLEGIPDGNLLFGQGQVAIKGSNGNTENHFQEEQELGGFGFGGFSFPSPSSGGDIAVMSRADSGKSLWSVRDIAPGRGDEGDEYPNGLIGPDDTLAVWKRKSNESSPIISPRNENTLKNLAVSSGSTLSVHSTDGYGSGEVKGEEEEVQTNHVNREESEAVAADDEEAAAVQEQIRRIRAEENEFETFNLKIIHRKNRTGFEEDKDFPVVINSVIAGRYHVTEYLGSAAFSKAIQAHDLHTGMDVCMKIIKNNKDFFDQSLDEIKLLKYINKNDPGDKHHVLRLYDYFYHREHLFIVCELLRANLYEFHKYNRESGGEVYFTMPRLQSITRQCLEALEFIHGLGLIHCDLKPENILVKSYSRCEVKVIDLGSSCFQTDHLCSYVQSRSYRAPEVILGLPYNQKIDMWSLGCILSELCSGNVLFQNDSLATLLARVIGILGPIYPEMLAKGRDTHKFFTKTHMLYERNQETEQLEYLLPKKTSLAHRLPMGDQGFVDFVGFLLQVSPGNRPTAMEALKHPWLAYPYEPISS